MQATAVKTTLANILFLRNLFLQEANCQIRYNACHERQWSDSYLLFLNGHEVGYGSVKGHDNHKDRDAIFEFYLLPAFRKWAFPVFQSLMAASGAAFIECQSNLPLLASAYHRFSRNSCATTILFEDQASTQLFLPDVVFRRRQAADAIFHHATEPAGEWVLEMEDMIVATGGYLVHYNFPFADLYMEVEEAHRRRGLGAYLLQEIKRECYLAGRIPSARCRIDNDASAATLQKAGFGIAGFMLLGEVS